MSAIEEKNKEMIRWYVANVLSKGDMETLLKVFAEDCIDRCYLSCGWVGFWLPFGLSLSFLTNFPKPF